MATNIATGAKVDGPLALATALVKVHAHTHAWVEIVKSVHYRNDDLRDVENLVDPFFQKAGALSTSDLLKLGEKQIAHPIDSHPPLSARLVSLQTDLETVVPLLILPGADASVVPILAEAKELEVSQSLKLRALLTA